MWTEHENPTLLGVKVCQDWLQTELTRKHERVAGWKDKVKNSATSNHSYVFHHLKHKCLNEPPNLVNTPDGSIVYQPQTALETINSQWDDVYSANVLHEDPVRIVQVLWPYIENDHVDAKRGSSTHFDMCLTGDP